MIYLNIFYEMHMLQKLKHRNSNGNAMASKKIKRVNFVWYTNVTLEEIQLMFRSGNMKKILKLHVRYQYYYFLFISFIL